MSRELAKRRLITVVGNERSGGGRAGRVLPKVARRLHEGVGDAELHIVTSTSCPLPVRSRAKSAVVIAFTVARPVTRSHIVEGT